MAEKISNEEIAMNLTIAMMENKMISISRQDSGDNEVARILIIETFQSLLAGITQKKSMNINPKNLKNRRTLSKGI